MTEDMARRKRGLLGVCSTLALLTIGAAGLAKAEPSVFPTGTTIYDPAKAYNSFVFFSGGDNISRLVDLNGNVVHQWNYAGFPSVLIDPALTGGKRGHVLLTLETSQGRGTDAGSTKPLANSIGTARQSGNSVKKLRVVSRNSIMISRACPMATRWSWPTPFIPFQVLPSRVCSTM
jgi:hypothetical protein